MKKILNFLIIILIAGTSNTKADFIELSSAVIVLPKKLKSNRAKYSAGFG